MFYSANLKLNRKSYQGNGEIKLLGDYFDGILLAFNYKAAIEGEQQLTRFRRTLTCSPRGRIRMLPESGSLCHVGFDAPGVAQGSCREETERDEGKRQREEERERQRKTSADSEKTRKERTSS